MLKLALLTSLFVSLCGVCFGYNLYVDSEANESGAHGSQDHPYVHIQDAINHAFDDALPINETSPSVVINVYAYASGYQENLNLNYMGDDDTHLVSDITIQNTSNDPEDCAIIASNSSLPVITLKGTTTSLFKLEGFEIKHSAMVDGVLNRGVFVTLPSGNYGYFGTLDINNCIFDNNHISIEIDNDMFTINLLKVINSSFKLRQHYTAQSIGIEAGFPGHGSNAYVSGNEFIRYNPNNWESASIEFGSGIANIELYDNLFDNAYVSSAGADVAGIFIHQDIVIRNNTFQNAGITIERVYGNWLIEQNKFSGLSSSSGFSPIELRGGAHTATTCSIEENIFFDCYKPLNIQLIPTHLDSRINTSIISNSFIDCSSILTMQRLSEMAVSSNKITEYRDNLYKGPSEAPFEIIDQNNNPLVLTGDNRIPVSYSHFSTELTATESLYPIQNVTYGDPYVSIDMENISYSLLWKTSVKSPCINSGYPGENNELTDPDGTPPDIGFVYYPHDNREYFERQDPSGIYWLSFPVLDDRTCTDDTYWNELGFMFIDHMLGAPNSQLNQIQWSYDGEDPKMQYISGEWYNSMNRSEQPKGYIVQFNQGMQIDPVIVNGFKADPDLTPAMWEATAGTEPFENWIGYYVPYTQKAGDAFSRFLPGSDRFRYLDYIYSIKNQKWSTCRISDEPGSPWIGDPNKYTLSEGDMVSLLLFPDAPEEMYWATLTTPSDPIERPDAETFAFEEELDYTPVFIEFDPADLPDEVGLFVNGECKGASVVDSTLVDVCFYDVEDKESGEIEVIFHYGNKGKKAAKGWKIYNPDRLVFEDGSLRSGQTGNYAYLSFQHEDGESMAPLVTKLQPNHPNPFNPSTTISFVMGRDMDARLDIYNVRGQRVNTLQKGQLAKGRHTFEWNGRDEQGSPVASGVYFSRLITPDGSFVNKMMLMK